MDCVRKVWVVVVDQITQIRVGRSSAESHRNSTVLRAHVSLDITASVALEMGLLAQITHNFWFICCVTGEGIY